MLEFSSLEGDLMGLPGVSSKFLNIILQFL